MWTIQETGHLKRFTLPGDPSTDIDISYITSDNTYITITNGIYHDRVYKPVYSDPSTIDSFETTEESM